MTRYNKKHEKTNKPFMKTHSRRTGAIILICLAFLLVGGSIFLYLAYLENESFEIELQKFLALSCDDMAKELKEKWQREAYILKIRAGEC